MRKEFSSIAENIVGSEIINLNNKVKNVNGAKNYTIGDFDPNIHKIPEQLKLYITEELFNNATQYAANNGEIPLKLAIKELMFEKGLSYNINQILIGCGVRPLIYLLFKTLIDENDKVAFPVPSWNNNHYSMLTKAQQIPIETTPENNFFPTIEDIKKIISDVNLICLCSPQNPTGSAIDNAVMEKIIELILKENELRILADKKPVYLFLDQVYSDLVSVNNYFNFEKFGKKTQEYIIGVDGISKTLCATGVRVGWLYGSERFINQASKIMSHLGAQAPRFIQLGVAKYLKQITLYEEFVSDKVFYYKEIFNKYIDILYNLKNLGYKVDYIPPKGAIYISIKLDYYDKFSTLNEMVDFLINECKIAIVPFEYFGSETNKGWFRLSIGQINLETIEDDLNLLQETIKKLHNK